MFRRIGLKVSQLLLCSRLLNRLRDMRFDLLPRWAWLSDHVWIEASALRGYSGS